MIHVTEHTYQLVAVCNDDCLCSHQRAFMHLNFEFDTDGQDKEKYVGMRCKGEYVCMRLLHGQSSLFS